MVRQAGRVGAGLLAALVFVGCPLLKDAISVSQASYDFRSSRQSWNLEVWNADSSIASLTVTAAPSESWIHVNPSSVTSTGPQGRRIITVSVSRQGLAVGTHQGTINFTARGAKAKAVTIKAYSDGSEGVISGDLNIVGMSQTFSAPYLLDFTFSLRDRDNSPVIGEPNQFTITCMEDGVPIPTDEGSPRFAKASDKQLKCFLVLDYSASMASTQLQGDANQDGKSDAIEAVETAIKTQFLPGLLADAMVGIYEFHREMAPERVCGFSADKQFVAHCIDLIWPQFVGPFSGVSRAWDAVAAALEEYGPEDRNDENRNVILVSDGHDTSSLHTKEQVIDSARQRGVRVYVVGFGKALDAGILQSIAKQTNAEYYSALAKEDLGDSFRQIIADLDGQYTLRWATLRRTDTKFTPSFQIAVGKNAASYTSTAAFGVADYTGDELAGVLRLVPSSGGDKATFFLRATYVSRYVWKLRLYVQSAYPFTVSKVATTEGGLCGAWTQTVSADPEHTGTWIYLESPDVGRIDTPIPFAAFGPMLRFDFDQTFDEGVIPFEALYVDNTLYAGGQAFSIEGWDNVLP